MRYEIWFRSYARRRWLQPDGTWLCENVGSERYWKDAPGTGAGDANAECERLQRILGPKDGAFFAKEAKPPVIETAAARGITGEDGMRP